MYKVRFNLGRGIRYLKWKVENLDTKVSEYYSPDDISLIMTECTLKNNRRIAEEILGGKNKRVCAWVLCEDVKVVSPILSDGTEISYNPKKLPYWTDGKLDLDETSHVYLHTNNRTIIKK